MSMTLYRKENFLVIGLFDYDVDFLRITKCLNQWGADKFRFKINFHQEGKIATKYNESHNNIKALKSLLRKEYNATEDRNWDGEYKNEN